MALDKDFEDSMNVPVPAPAMLESLSNADWTSEIARVPEEGNLFENREPFLGTVFQRKVSQIQAYGPEGAHYIGSYRYAQSGDTRKTGTVSFRPADLLEVVRESFAEAAPNYKESAEQLVQEAAASYLADPEAKTRARTLVPLSA